MFFDLSVIACPNIEPVYKSEIDFNKCVDEILDFSLYDMNTICECNNIYSSTKDKNDDYLSTSDKLISRLYPLMHELSSELIFLEGIDDILNISVCSMKKMINDLPKKCTNNPEFKDVIKNVSKEFSKYGNDHNVGLDAFSYNIANSILYKVKGRTLPDSNYKNRNTCYSDNILNELDKHNDDFNTLSKKVSPEVFSILKQIKSDKGYVLSDEHKSRLEKVLNIQIETTCNAIKRSIQMACPNNKPSYKNEIVVFAGNMDAKYQEAYNVANSKSDVISKIDKFTHLCNKDKNLKNYSYDNYDYISEQNNYSMQESNIDSLSKSYEDEYGLCAVMCEDAPGPYSISETCKMKEADTVLENLGCNNINDEISQRNCRIVSKLYEDKVVEKLSQTTNKIVNQTKGDIIVDDDYDRVISGVPKTLVKFLSIEKKFHEEIGVKPDLVTESEFVAAATASNDSASSGGVKNEYRDSGKVKKEWVNAGEIRDEFAGSGKSIDSGAATVLNTSGFSAQGSQVVIPRSPGAKKINELVEKVKVAKARTQVFRERVDKLEREGKGVDIASRWNNPISSLGSFENNWGVGSDNPAIRGYNSDGTSFEYPAVFNNRFGGVDAGRGRGYGSRGRELNENEKFTKAMYDRGLKTNISGVSNESVADSSSGGRSSAGGPNSGGGILSSGGTSAGGASRGPASGGSEMSEIAQHFKGLLGGEAAVKRDIKDVEMKQVRVFRNDYNDEGKVVLEELLAEHKDIKIGDPFIVYRYDNGDTYRATLLPLFDPDGKLQGYRVDKNDLVGKSREFANSIIASENFLR